MPSPHRSYSNRGFALVAVENKGMPWPAELPTKVAPVGNWLPTTLGPAPRLPTTAVFKKAFGTCIP
eukprot:11563812-Alexandrium_andersonii.AAC.1